MKTRLHVISLWAVVICALSGCGGDDHTTGDSTPEPVSGEDRVWLSPLQIDAAFLEEVVGKPGPTKIDMGVYAHGQFVLATGGDEEPMSDEEIAKGDVITIGSEDEPITIRQVRKAFEEYAGREGVRRLLNSGRSYFYEGTDYQNGHWRIAWGS